MDASIIGLQRLTTQRINNERLSTPADIVTWMGAMQAQDYKQALWAIGARLKSGTIADVEAAIERGEILRTWPMRGTIHFVPREDARWMLDLCASRIVKSTKGRREQLGLDADTLARSIEIIQNALVGQNRLERQDLLRVLEDAGISMQGQRGYHTLSYAATTGVICIGPMQGKQQTFVLLAEWVPNTHTLARDDALAELTDRYFRSHAPATIDDFARWSGLTKTDVKRGIKTLGDALIVQEIEGIDYFVPANISAPTTDDAPQIYLLAAYDEYVLGYKNRDAVLATKHAQKVVPGNNGVFYPIIVIDGHIVGTWQRKLNSNSMNLKFQFYESANGLEDRVTTEAQKYCEFMQLPIASITVD